MDLAVELVVLHCLAEVAGLAVPLQPAEEVALADSQHFVEGAGLAGSRRFAEEAGLAGFVVVVEFLLVEQSWTLQSPHNVPEGILD
jgi:hypothetical protein